MSCDWHKAATGEWPCSSGLCANTQCVTSALLYRCRFITVPLSFNLSLTSLFSEGYSVTCHFSYIILWICLKCSVVFMMTNQLVPLQLHTFISSASICFVFYICNSDQFVENCFKYDMKVFFFLLISERNPSFTHLISKLLSLVFQACFIKGTDPIRPCFNTILFWSLSNSPTSFLFLPALYLTN